MVDALSPPKPERVLVTSVRELVKVLEEIHRHSSCPILAQLFSDQGNSMIIGLGSEQSFLAYYEDNDLGPCFYSLSPNYKNRPYDPMVDSVDFFYFGADTEISERYFIDLHTAISVMSEYFETENKSLKIEWERV